MEHVTSTMPGYALDALEMMNYPDPYDDRLLDAFRAHWGGFALPSLLRAIRDAGEVGPVGNIAYPDQPEERIFAMFAAAFSGATEARDALAPFLSSAAHRERWAAALGLGYQQDDRALPVLFGMLTEYLPPHLIYVEKNTPEWRNERWRGDVPRLLVRPGDGHWRRPAFIAPLRDVMRQYAVLLYQPSLDVTRSLEPLHPQVRKALWRSWRGCANVTVYALGRLRAFSALAEALQGVTVPEEQIRVWQTHLVMGVLLDRFPDMRLWAWSDRPDVREAAARLLEEAFGLDPTAREQALTLYATDTPDRESLLSWFGMTPSPWVNGWL